MVGWGVEGLGFLCMRQLNPQLLLAMPCNSGVTLSGTFRASPHSHMSALWRSSDHTVTVVCHFPESSGGLEAGVPH